MKIYVTRHGQSMTNIDADINAPFRVNLDNNVLTEEGIAQAMGVGREAKELNIHQIIASPLSRTKQTAFCIASVMANCVPLCFDNRFREIEWDVGGEFDRLENYIPGFDSKNLPIDHRPLIDHKRGAITLESQLDVYNRVVPAFHEVVERHRGINILIVTHFFVVRALEAYMKTGSPWTMTDYSPKNTIIYEYDIADVDARKSA